MASISKDDFILSMYISSKSTDSEFLSKPEDDRKVAVELNGAIINKKKYKKRLIKNNDKVEIVHFIGGG